MTNLTTPKPGLYQKFDVKRIVGEDKPNEEYFVLSPTHDPLARKALEYYANLCSGVGLKELAEGIWVGIRRVENGMPFYSGEEND